jgi:bifunctional enzyme CysN/CysC
MVTGASTADLAIVLVDARNGVVEQSRRHAFLAALLRVPHVVLAVNKMDLVDWSKDRFAEIVTDFVAFAADLGLPDVTAIPMAALLGDNVVHESEHMPWYDGLPLLGHLEQVELVSDHNRTDARFPVQYVIRPISEAFHDYRGYAGVVASGVFRPGDEVVVLPSGRRTTIAGIDVFDRSLDAAFAPLAVTLRLTDDLDVSRGDMICAADDLPSVGQEIVAHVCWLTDAPLRQGARLGIKHTTRTTKAVVSALDHRIDTTTLKDVPAESLGLNDIGVVTLRTAAPLFHDPYSANRATGSFILIDEATGTTAGAGMIVADAPPRGIS